MSTRSEVLNWDVAFEYKDLKQLVHKQLLEEMDLESLRRLDDETARARVSDSIRNLLHRQRSPLTQNERDQMVAEVLCELFGLGPLEPLLADPTVSDILINGSRVVYVERYGRLERTEIHFDDDHHLSRIIDRIVSRVGRRVDESSPMVDARLPDGSRVNVIISPLSLQGPVVSIRRFGKDPLTANDLVAKETLSETMLELLQCAVKGKLNVLISGGTGAGKTTLLNVLSAYIPADERIITIEDRRVATETGAHHPAGNAPAQHRRQGRDQAAAAGDQLLTYAAGPDHRWRSSR